MLPRSYKDLVKSNIGPTESWALMLLKQPPKAVDSLSFLSGILLPQCFCCMRQEPRVGDSTLKRPLTFLYFQVVKSLDSKIRYAQF